MTEHPKTFGLTKEQQLATDPTSSIWVGANAGTGKTHVLSARVLRMMVTGTHPGKILCLTYTKAGANEMANRVTKELGEWTALSDAQLALKLFERVGEQADAKMLSRARTLFAEVLDLPGGLKIRTIHAFFQSLLGRFPVEAGITPRFELIEDRTKDELTQKAMDGVYAKAKDGNNPKIMAALAHIAIRVAEQTFADLMADLGKEQGHLQKLNREKGSLAGIIAATYRALGLTPGMKEKDLFEKIALPKGQGNGGMDDAIVKRIMTGLLSGTKTDQNRGAIVDTLLATNIEKRAPFALEYTGVFLTKSGTLRATLATKGVLSEFPDLEDILLDEANRIKGLYDQIELLNVVENTKAILVLAEAVLEGYAQHKQNKGQLDYDDVILKSSQLLSTPGIAPWILFKMDEGLDHILVDEAQDTNLDQWQLIETLSDEFFVGEGAVKKTRTVFAVGDAKQSIYKFQKADPKEFIHARERVREKAKAANLSFANVPLEKSFRSTAAVLNMVDAVFAQDEARANLTLDTDAITHDVHRMGEGGLVELWPPAIGVADALPEDWEPPTKQIQKTSVEAQVATKIANKITSMIRQGDELKSKGRGVRAGDILVLVRNRQGDFIDQLVRQLKAKNIAVAGSDRLVVTEDLAVMDLMALADFCLLTDDDLTLATVLKGPLIGFNEDQLFSLAHGRGKISLWQKLREGRKNNDAFEKGYDFLSALLRLVDFESPHEFFSKILTQFGGRKKLMARLGIEIADPLDEFLSLALSFEQTHTASLQGFLHWLRTGSAEIKRELQETRDEVRIMTTHGAKGLQAPIVFLPDCCRVPTEKDNLHRIPDLTPGKQSNLSLIVWPKSLARETDVIKAVKEASKQEGLAEYKRLMYVAMTRAEDRLYITGWKKKNSSSKSWYDHIEAGMKSLEATQVINDGEGGTLLKLTSEQTKRVTLKTDDRIKDDAIKATPIWATKPPKAEAQPSRPLAPSRFDDEEPPAKSPLDRQIKSSKGQVLGASGPAYKRGTIIHKLLELLPELPVDQRHCVAKKWLARPVMELTSDEQDDILTSTLEVLNHKDLTPLFGPGSRAEVSLTGVVGSMALSGEIDRLVVLENEVLVIDYKTNRPPPTTLDAVPTKYLKQMAAYRGLLQNIYPKHTITMALLWTEDVRLMTLNDALLDPFAPK